jgi:hypothetical protein
MALTSSADRWQRIWDGAEATLARLFGAVDERESAEVVELRPVEDESEGDDRE